MNQKEFELIAGVINGLQEQLGITNTSLLVEHFVIALAASYPKTFDSNKFLKALGL